MRSPGRAAPVPSLFKIDSFLFDDERALLNIGVDGSDILTHHPHKEKLDGTDKKEADNQRSDADRQPIPEQELVCQIHKADEKG